jgi:glucose-6-phosphate 1-epimerase
LTEEEKAIKITGPVDRVYESSPRDVKVLSKSKTLFTIERENLVDVVVWNPWTQGAASMTDFEPKDAYKNMVSYRYPTLI